MNSLKNLLQSCTPAPAQPLQWFPVVCDKCGCNDELSRKVESWTCRNCEREALAQQQREAEIFNYWRASDCPIDLSPIRGPLPHQVTTWQAIADAPYAVLYSAIYGTGKSTLAAMWMRRQIKRECREAAWLTAYRFASIRQRNRIEEIEDLESVRFLVLDDLRITDLTDLKRGELREYLKNRLNERRPTVITSNLSPRDMIRQFPEWESIFDSMRQGGVFMEVRTPDGKSLRGKNG